MIKEIDEIINELKSNVTSPDFLDVCDRQIEKLNALSNPVLSIEHILSVMEKNPNVDYGMPGPLVHFVEQFFRNGYEEKLIESLNRAPTLHTLWMLNRILNSVSGEEKLKLMTALENVINRQDIDQNIINEAKEFREMQEE